MSSTGARRCWPCIPGWARAQTGLEDVEEETTPGKPLIPLLPATLAPSFFSDKRGSSVWGQPSDAGGYEVLAFVSSPRGTYFPFPHRLMSVWVFGSGCP